MPIEIFGSFERNKRYCAGSVTKLLTTFVSLSLLSEKYDLNQVLDDENFLDQICTNAKAKQFLRLFQKIIGSQFTLRDVCTYYLGLPYTFEPTRDALESVDAGNPFKHHSILDEKTFLSICKNNVSPLYRNRSKFHYSEISIIFLAYLIEKIYDTNMETLYQKYVVEKFNLKQSELSRVRPKDVFVQDLSGSYDYAAVAEQNHGYFCYSNGFYTTLNDMKVLIEGLQNDKIFQQMIDMKHARAAAPDLMNGLTIELRVVGDDIIYGYEGLSFSGCNVWAYSTKLQQGYLTFCNSEEDAYTFIYEKFGYDKFDNVPAYTEKLYSQFLSSYTPTAEAKDIPVEYQGNYYRVTMNGSQLTDTFVLGNNFLKIRDPNEITYDLMSATQGFHIKGDDGTHESRLSLYQAKSGNRYMFYNGTLYKRSNEAKDESKDTCCLKI